MQGETNIHNLPDFWQLSLLFYGGVSLYGAIGWIVFRPKKNKTLILFRRYFIPCPILFFYFIPYEIFGFLINVTPDNYLSIETFSPVSEISIPQEVWYNLFWNGDAEIGEFLLSLGILFFILTSVYRVRKN